MNYFSRYSYRVFSLSEKCLTKIGQRSPITEVNCQQNKVLKSLFCLISSKITEQTWNVSIIHVSFQLLKATLPDKNSWDTSTECYFFPFRTPLLPLNVVNRSLVTISCMPTLRGQADGNVSQQFRLVVSLKRNLWHMLHVSLYWRENFCEA